MVGEGTTVSLHSLTFEKFIITLRETWCEPVVLHRPFVMYDDRGLLTTIWVLESTGHNTQDHKSLLLFKMLFKIFRRNLIPHKVNNKGSCMPLACSHSETIPLNSSSSPQPMVKPHFRGNCDFWWGCIISSSLGLSSLFLFCIPSWRSERKFARVSKTQSSCRIPAPCQEFSRGGESTKVGGGGIMEVGGRTKATATMDNRNDGSILKFWDNGWRCPWSSSSFSLEHHKG